VERASARNTLTAYGKDLEDARGYLAGAGGDLDTASTEAVEAEATDAAAPATSDEAADKA
ncbi:MAG: recombinase XerD, partial [Actinobacteria bacterium]|nr:recombinase XerD [Actinomycetota bacterium]